jgi:hypothetical protein
MGVNEMSREYKRTNRTLAAVQSEQRIDWQKRLAEDMTVNRRFARQANLYVTPRMLRESYDKLRGDLFVRKATARVVLLRFDGQDAQQRAAEAAELWRKDALETGQLVERFPSAMLLPETEANDLGSGLATIKQFALAGPEGTVSEPVKSGAYFYVARVSKHRTERNGRFEDPDVQRELQQLCANSVYREFRHEAMDRAKQRTEVWRR